MRCSGKSTVGRRLAELLERPFLDLDEELVKAARSAGSPGEFLRREGVEAFRELEAEVLGRVLLGRVLGAAREDKSPVLATGGGVVERPGNRLLLASSAVCVWLDVPAEVLRRRMSLQPEPSVERPALEGEDPLEEIPRLLARRAEFYQGLAAHVVEAGSGSVDEVARKIHATLTGEGD